MRALRLIAFALPPGLLVAVAVFAYQAQEAEAGSSDIVINGYFQGPAEAVENQPVTFTVTVTNTGGSTSGDFWVDIYADLEDPPATGDFGDDFCRILSLGASGSAMCDVSLIYPAEGTYEMYIQADTENEVIEPNESNNVSGPNFIVVVGDADADSVGNPTDNCLLWPNPSQNLPPWIVPAGDSDCDGFSDVRETDMTTDPTTHCAADTGVNNEDPPDFWPFDMDDNRRANTIDIGFYVGKLGLVDGAPGWTPRLNLSQQGMTRIINTVDIGLYVPRLGNLCSPIGS